MWTSDIIQTLTDWMDVGANRSSSEFFQKTSNDRYNDLAVKNVNIIFLLRKLIVIFCLKFLGGLLHTEERRLKEKFRQKAP